MTDLHSNSENDLPMNLDVLSDAERTLIVSLRSDDRDTATEAFRTLIWNWLAPMFDPSEASANNPYFNNPDAPPAPAPKRISKVRLWLIKHGVEFEWSDHTDMQYDRFQRHFAVVLNHRFWGFDFVLHIEPFRGVFDDELHTPHAEIAAQYNVRD